MNAQGPRRPRRAIDGVLLLDKPRGISSQAAVSRAKNLLGAAKAGHTGTLDPMATGLLPVAFGEATKFSQALLEADKGYIAEVRLGVTTTTGDAEGEVMRTVPVAVDRAQVEATLAPLRGETEQTPPMYSALKYAGRPLYEYARAGAEIERAPRRIRISTLEIVDLHDDLLTILVVCSKGTYIRVLGENIGEALGCGASLGALRRTHVGRFSVDQAIGLEDLTAASAGERLARLLPVDALVADLPRLELGQDEAARLLRGQALLRATAQNGLVRVYGPGPAFLGVAERAADGLRARRLVATEPFKLGKTQSYGVK